MTILKKINQNNKRKSSSKPYLEVVDPLPQSTGFSQKASFLQWLTFSDVFKYIKTMNKTTKFGDEDVPNPEAKFNVEPKLAQLEANWKYELTKENPSFSKALCQTFLREIMKIILLFGIDNTTKIFYSTYMGKIVSIITSNNLGDNLQSYELISSAIILSMLVIVSIFAKVWALYITGTTLAQVRLATTAILYKKLNLVSLNALQNIKIGRIINLIGNDINDIQALYNLPTTILAPYMMLLGTYIMWGYFGPSCLVGLLTLIFVILSQIYLSNRTESPRLENKKTTDERVKLVHEVIEGIRLIKMYTWEKLFQSKIEDLRQNEKESFLKIARIDALGNNLSALSVYITILVICVVYTLSQGVLSPEKVYASMLILMYLSSCLTSSHHGRLALVNFQMIVDRVKEVLIIQEIISISDQPDIDNYKPKITTPVSFTNFTAYWNNTNLNPCLSCIDLTFPLRSLTAIIGKVGSGKSSLLLSFLRELPRTMGSLQYSGTIAYVEQDAMIFSGTLRENVLFGREYHEPLYNQVLKDCRLNVDLENFLHGDLTYIGEKGVNLSGGQKARVSLARALYSESDIYLLDDPFSALDSKVAREIFSNVLKEKLAKEKIIILVTHHLNFAKEADHVVLMDNGRVQAQGKFSELEKLDISLLNIFKGQNQNKAGEDTTKNEIEAKVESKVVQNQKEEVKQDIATEVTWGTYKDYFSVKGSVGIFSVLVSLFMATNILVILYTRFIGYWAERQTLANSPAGLSGQEYNNSSFIFVSSGLLVSLMLLNYIKTLQFVKLFLATNTELHYRMLTALFRAKTIFFDRNPLGRILNRFSNDIGLLDKTNPRTTYDMLENITSYLTLLITICIISPFIIIPSIVMLFGLYRAKKFFEKPITRVKQLEFMSKGPMISYVPATLQGLIIIRAYNQGGRFIKDFMGMVYNNIKMHNFQERATRLFCFVLDTPIQLLTLSGVWIFIAMVFNQVVNSSLLGLCLMYLLKIGDQGSILIRQSVYIDINMQSAQRILDYCLIESEPPQNRPDKDQVVNATSLNQRWPTKGEIVFNNVFLRYRQDLGLALKGLSFTISAGLKVACVGRTGAGKSSIVQALFRMTEIERSSQFRDSYIKVDGVDIEEIGLNLLRGGLSIIPQTPIVFSGTIRRNLDPFDRVSEASLWRTLEQIGLKAYVESLPDQLDTDITTSANIFSVGQKQLVCLGRAIVSNNKVIVLDEATANVDVETDSFIQKTIMERFKDCTVLTIAHRLITIANYDKVLVVENGAAVEYDIPYKLLVGRIGDGNISRKDGLFAEMVRNTGESMANKIFNITKEHYYSNN